MASTKVRSWPQLKPRITHHACTVGFHVILHNEWSVLISAALIVRLGRRRGHSRFSRGLQRAVCSLRGWKTRLLSTIFLKSGNRTRGRGRMKNRPKNRKLPDFRISGKNLNSGKTANRTKSTVKVSSESMAQMVECSLIMWELLGSKPSWVCVFCCCWCWSHFFLSSENDAKIFFSKNKLSGDMGLMVQMLNLNFVAAAVSNYWEN